jgi:protein-S-isoprenylcysteine O-methyltransferase Ste14
LELAVNVVAFILLIIAAVLFAVAAAYQPAPAWLTNAGLCLLTVALLVQFAAKSHSISF